MNNDMLAVLKLPLVRFAPFYAAGLLTAFYCGFELQIILIIAALTALVLLLHFKKILAVCAAGLLLGMITMTLQMMFYCEPIIEYNGKTVRAECRIKDVVSSDDSALYDAQINIAGRNATVRLFGTDKAQVGDIIDATITFRETDREYVAENLSKSIFLYGNIDEYHSVKSGTFSFSRTIYYVRENITGFLKQYIGGDEEALIMSMMFGDSSLMTTELMEDINVSGAAHFTAVSGTHFAIFSTVLLELIACKYKKPKAILALIFIPIAVIFFGGSASVLRSAIMLAVCNIAPLMMRKAETLNSLCFAVLAMTIFTPRTVLDAGFQMSVLGVFGAGIIGNRYYSILQQSLPQRFNRLRFILKPLIISICSIVCTSPVSIRLFGGISAAGAVTSLIVMPLFMAAMLFTLLAGVTHMQVVLIPTALLMKALCAVVKLFGGMRSLWIPMDFKGAVVLSALCALLLSLAAIFPKKMFHYGTYGFSATVLAALVMCLFVRQTRCKIDFISDGTSGAAVIAVGSEATVFISGTGTGFSDELLDCLRRNGALKVNCVVAPNLIYSGAIELGKVSELITVEQIYAEYNNCGVLQSVCGGSMIFPKTIDHISVSGITISSAAAGDTTHDEDIVIYYSYKKSVPENSAEYALYASSSQKELPDNGVSLYRQEFTVNPKQVDKVIIC